MSIDSPPLAPSRLRQAVLRLRMGPCALKPASSDGIEVFFMHLDTTEWAQRGLGGCASSSRQRC